MSNILQWEPEQSRVWGSARIGNILHLRDDLTQLADWIKTKADTASLTGKADVAKLLQLEETLGGTRLQLESTKRDIDNQLQYLRRQLEELERWSKSGEFEKHLQALCDQQIKIMDELATRQEGMLSKLAATSQEAQGSAAASLTQCRAIQETLLQSEDQTRDLVAQNLKTIEEHVSETSANVEQAKKAAELTGAFRIECEELTQALRSRADELTAAWQDVSQTLTTLSTRIEQSVARAVGLAQEAQKALDASAATVQQNQQLHTSFQAELLQASERMAKLLRETEAQANSALHNGHLAAAASDLSGVFKADCENLAQAIRSKGDELTANWDQMRQELSALSNHGEQHASQAADWARQAGQSLAECQANIQAAQELQTNLGEEQKQMAQRLSALEQTFEPLLREGFAAGAPPPPDEKLNSRLDEAESKLQALTQALDEQRRENQDSRDEIEAMAQHLNSQIVSLQLRDTSFWRRIRWLLQGSRGG